LKAGVAVLLLATLACSGNVTSVPSPDPISTTVAQTLQALTPLASPTQPTTTVVPTSSSASPPAAPTTSNLPASTRISFAAGATYSITQGTINAGQTLHYVVRASGDQPLIVMLSTPDNSAKLSVFGADGTVILPQSGQATSWQGHLPSTQDYYFRLTGGGSAQDFMLNVNIPARLQFSSGQSQATFSGQTVGGNAISYVSYALGGPELEVTVNTAPEVAALTIWGFTDGQPYARAQNGVTDFSMTLPSTQDYIIEVIPQGGNVVDYELKVKIQ